MDDDKQQNLDSFVDIVANTAGMLIVLVVFVIMLTGKKAVEVDPAFIALSNLNRDVSGLQQQEQEIARKVETQARERESATAALRSSLAAMNLSENEAARVPEIVSAAEETAQTLSASLSQFEREAEEAGLELDRARAEVAREFPQEQIDELEAIDLGDLETGLSSLREEIAALRTEAGGHEAAREAVLSRIDELAKETALLEAQGGGVLTVVDPTVRTEQGRAVVWAECFVPAGTDAVFIRLLTGENYVRTEAGLSPVGEGERAADVIDSASAFQRHLASIGQEGTREGYCLMLLVRPDAYGGFRVARQVARDLGWDVDWRPIEALPR